MTIIRYLFLLPILYSCSNRTMMNEKPQVTSLSYLALGDSYTIGEAVPVSDRFPEIVAEKLQSGQIEINELKIIATTGWTTDELIQAIQKEELNPDWDLVTLLIGVNNEYREYPFDQYKKEFILLLDKAIDLARDDSSRVVVLSIPDYAFTPFGQAKNPDKITATLKLYNEYAKGICEKRKIKFINITGLTQLGLERPDYVASDGLHPSGLMYRYWVDTYYDTFKKAISP